MTTYARPPYDPYAVPDGLEEVWATAWGHIGYIEWIMLGDASPQLTAAPLPPVQPCTCRYAVQHIRGVIGTIPLDLYGIGKRYGVWCFTIDHWCPHHGIPGAHEGREQAYREMDVEEATYWTTLDQDERTGH
jgi:hypothetical protein